MDWEAFLAPALRAVRPYVPGKPIEEVRRELGLAHIDKLASNENVLGTNPASVKAVAAALEEQWLYPDSGCWHLSRALAERVGSEPGSVLVTGGSVELLYFLAVAALGPGDEAVSPFPSFAMYPIAAGMVGAKFIRTGLRPDYGYDIDAIIAALTPRTKVVFLANPNNPTGVITTREEVARLVDALPAGALLVLDEAYWDIVEDDAYPDGVEWVRAGAPVLVARSFSKGHGLAGFRVGFGVGPLGLMDGLRRVYPPFNVSTPAQVAALAALGNPEHLERTKEFLAAERPRLAAALRAAGYPVPKSRANFVCVGVGQDAVPVFETLQAQGLIVRPLHGFGLPDHIRVTVGFRETNERLVAALCQAAPIEG